MLSLTAMARSAMSTPSTSAASTSSIGSNLWVLVVSPVERRERRWLRDEEERGRERVGREEGWEGPARREERSGEWRASRVL